MNKMTNIYKLNCLSFSLASLPVSFSYLNVNWAYFNTSSTRDVFLITFLMNTSLISHLDPKADRFILSFTLVCVSNEELTIKEFTNKNR